jgi:hypothetical protein
LQTLMRQVGLARFVHLGARYISSANAGEFNA